jgi:hypothetical protein
MFSWLCLYCHDFGHGQISYIYGLLWKDGVSVLNELQWICIISGDKMFVVSYQLRRGASLSLLSSSSRELLVFISVECRFWGILPSVIMDEWRHFSFVSTAVYNTDLFGCRRWWLNMQFDCFEYKCYIAFNLRVVNIRCRIRFYFLYLWPASWIEQTHGFVSLFKVYNIAFSLTHENNNSANSQSETVDDWKFFVNLWFACMTSNKLCGS